MNQQVTTDKHVLIDVSHAVEDGMITYQGLPAPIICDYLLQYYNERLNGRAVMVRPALMAKMQRYSWPGLGL